MKKLLLTSLVALFTCVSLNAQQAAVPSCPQISVSGPAGLVQAGELAPYTVAIDVSEDQKQRLQYVWRISGGEIVTGQGTETIYLRQPQPSFLVTVVIKGLPEGCPNEASVSAACGLVAPVPEKIAQYDGVAFKGAPVELDGVVQEMNENPNNQLFVFFAYKAEPAGQDLRREKLTLEYLAANIGGSERITFVRQFEGVGLVQFWRVPPGANNPLCEGCKESETVASACPEISVTGPAGVQMPHEAMSFHATLTGDVPKGVTFHWEVTEGAIMGGQGTPVLKARYINKSAFRATVTVGGLPAGCPMTASERLNMSDPHGPEYLGAVNNPTYSIDRKLLTAIGESLKSNDSSHLYVWAYVGSQPQAKLPSLRDRLLRQLSLTRIHPSRITLTTSSEKPRGIIFWLVPPGSEDPLP